MVQKQFLKQFDLERAEQDLANKVKMRDDLLKEIQNAEVRALYHVYHMRGDVDQSDLSFYTIICEIVYFYSN